MTIPSTTRKAGPLQGTGSQTAWPFTFKVFAASDVKVTIANSEGVETQLAINTDYTVTLNSNQETSPGGSVTYPVSGSALAVGSVLSIVGDVDYDQQLDIPSGGNFSPLALENQLDRATMQIQQLKEEVDRSAKLPVTNDNDPQTLVEDLVRLADSADNIDTLVANLTSITTVAADLNEPVSEINAVATSIANVNTVGTNIANVSTVAGISANVTSVAGNATNINAVAANATNITAVAGNGTNITAVAGNATNINAVNANKINIDAVAANATNITAVAGNSANINAVNTNKTNIDTVAGNTANVTTVAGISGDVTAVAGISADVAAVENIAANVTTVAGVAANVTAVAGIGGNVTTVAGISANVTTVATNIASVNSAATNLAAIIAAPSEATAAAASASSASASATAAAASVASGMYSSVQDKSADYTVVTADAGDLIRVTTTGGARTITLPAISGQVDGFKVAVAKWSGDANAVTIARSSADLINGSVNYVLDAQYKSATFVADLETNTWFAAGTGGGGTNILVDSFSGTGAQTAFTLSGDPGSENNTQVFISGVYQDKGQYSIAGTTLTFSAAPPSGTSNIEVVWSIPLAIGTPSDGTVTTTKLGDLSVTTGKMADAAVTSTKIADSNVTAAKLADLNVTTAKLADANVTTAKLADLAVTAGKLASGAAASNLGFTAANDGAVVHNTGTETVAGVKTFSSAPVMSAGVKVSASGWSVIETSTVLYFAYGGVNKFKIDSSGNLTVVGNVTAYGTV